MVTANMEGMRLMTRLVKDKLSCCKGTGPLTSEKASKKLKGIRIETLYDLDMDFYVFTYFFKYPTYLLGLGFNGVVIAARCTATF